MAGLLNALFDRKCFIYMSLGTRCGRITDWSGCSDQTQFQQAILRHGWSGHCFHTGQVRSLCYRFDLSACDQIYREPSSLCRVLAQSMIARDPKEKAQMDHSTHTQLVDSELTEANLMDAVIYGAMDEKIGTVAHVHGMGAATQVIVDVGGFLGLGAKSVAMTTDQLNFMRDEDGGVHATTTWTKDEVKSMPEHSH